MKQRVNTLIISSQRVFLQLNQLKNSLSEPIDKPKITRILRLIVLMPGNRIYTTDELAAVCA